MLPRKKRLNRAVFSNVSRGKVLHFPLFSMRAFSSSTEEARFSVVVSKKVAAKATKRNELRRFVYELVRKHSSGGRSVIFFLKKDASTAPKASLKGEIMSALHQSERQLDKNS